jgi:predicted nuclease of predicted toxin-antitoxin system
VPSKKRSSISRRGRQRRTRYFIDRSLGSYYLPLQLRQANLDITVHDDVYPQTERDPLIFYQCGKKGLVVITSDTSFRKSFPHMAAIALGKTSVIAFSNNNYKSNVRGNAFLKALPQIEPLLSKIEF